MSSIPRPRCPSPHAGSMQSGTDRPSLNGRPVGRTGAVSSLELRPNTFTLTRGVKFADEAEVMHYDPDIQLEDFPPPFSIVDLGTSSSTLDSYNPSPPASSATDQEAIIISAHLQNMKPWNLYQRPVENDLCKKPAVLGPQPSTIYLESTQLPWTIAVTTRLGSEFITISDVLNAIHDKMQAPVKSRELLRENGDHQRTIEQASRQRRIINSGTEVSDTVLRVDFLGKKHFFLGLTSTEKHDRWEMLFGDKDSASR
ncbi:hypothetical protein B0H34DRAFT_860304 [Crassisporium funariophilum]|nr:hypothetical protein B0H34DRAFT_860304 [Crassisporium funariophilum]